MNKKMKTSLISAVCIALALITAVTFAWLYSSNRQAFTEQLQVDVPPVLYILDEKAEDMEVISLEGLKVGRTKRVLFGVSAVYDINDESNGSLANFKMQLAYTNNLKANLDVYAADYEGTSEPQERTGYGIIEKDGRYYSYSEAPLEYVDRTAAGNNKVAVTSDQPNYATYHFYDTGDALRFMDSTPNADQLFNKRKIRFFVLEISWPDGTQNVDAKEVDMIYIMASGTESE